MATGQGTFWQVYRRVRDLSMSTDRTYTRYLTSFVAQKLAFHYVGLAGGSIMDKSLAGSARAGRANQCCEVLLTKIVVGQHDSVGMVGRRKGLGDARPQGWPSYRHDVIEKGMDGSYQMSVGHVLIRF